MKRGLETRNKQETSQNPCPNIHSISRLFDLEIFQITFELDA